MPKNKSLTFYNWLILQTKRNDPIGDLARDVVQDESSPGNVSISQWRSYMRYATSYAPAMQAFEQAVKEYSLL